MKKKLLLVSAVFFAGLSVFAQSSVIMDTTMVDTTAVDTAVSATQAIAIPSLESSSKETLNEEAPVESAEPAKQKKERADMSSTIDGGLYLRAGYMLPSSDYMTGNAKNGYDFQMGSQFYIGPIIANFMRFGLDVTWYDFAYAELDAANGHSLTASAFGVGPMVSFAPAKHFVINTYVKALPTFAFAGGEESIPYYDTDTETYLYSEDGFVGRGGFCVAGVWGLELRYRMLDIGFEMVWGEPKVAEVGSSVTDVVANEFGVPVAGEIQKIDPYKINNSRVYIGIKF